MTDEERADILDYARALRREERMDVAWGDQDGANDRKGRVEALLKEAVS